MLYKEARKRGNKEPQAGGGGKRCVGKWANPGLGGQERGKWTGFSHFEITLTHLFPHKSTQVVDFPHIYTVRLFWEVMKWVATDETQIKHGLGKEIEQNEAEETEKGTIIARTFTGFFTCKSLIFHEVSRFYAQIRAVFTRFYAFLRVGPILDANFTKERELGKNLEQEETKERVNRETCKTREPNRMNTDTSLVMRRLGGGGFDALELGGFDGLGKALLEGRHFNELAGLLKDDLVELVVLMLQVGEVRFQLFDALGKFFVHAPILMVLCRKAKTVLS